MSLFFSLYLLKSRVSRMAPRGVCLLLALSAALSARSCCAYTCPAVCRCRADTFQCSGDTQRASGAAAASVRRL